jgi:integrase
MERHKVKHKEVQFLRLADLGKILGAAVEKRPDLVPLILLVCFAGLRPSEAVRLDWREVGADYIRLPGDKSKTGYSRQIPIQDNLKLWLAPCRKPDGPVCPGTDLTHFNRTIRCLSGVQLSHDAMRHGYGSHRQRVVNNVSQVAEEMGHSVQVARRHYLNPFCTPEEAKEWFGIGPQQDSNIIALPQEKSDGEQQDPAQAADRGERTTPTL